MFDKGPGWVRLGNVTPEIAQRMDRAGRLEAARWGYLDTYNQEYNERMTRLERDHANAQRSV